MKRKKVENQNLELNLGFGSELNEQGKRSISDYYLKLELILKPEQRILNDFGDLSLDRSLEIQNFKTRFFDPGVEIAENTNYISHLIRDYKARVPKEFYIEIYRLQGWEIPKNGFKEKPSIVGRFTNELIYSRFTKETLPELRKRNPYIKNGKRNFKHFQFLSNAGITLFDQFIQDAIEVMKRHDDWYSFRRDYSVRFNLPFQLNWEREL